MRCPRHFLPARGWPRTRSRGASSPCSGTPEVNPDCSRSAFAQGTLSPFLNFHRPCLFATEHRDGDVMTSYARLRSIPGARGLLKPGLGFALLDAAAAAETDLEAARRVQAARRELFLRISAGMAAARAAG